MTHSHTVRTLRSLAPFALGCALAGALAACDEPAEPTGTSGSITARAYIDRDASGTFTAGDSSLSGLTVALQREGQTMQTGTTGTDGRVVFSDVPPGSYQVVAPAAPTGATLTTSPFATAAVSFQGSSPSVDIRYAFFPSSISGRLFRDDNLNGTFDPAADTPGGGIKVLLRPVTGGAAGAAIDSTTTDNLGAYSFPRIGPGSYVVEFENPNPADPNFFGPSGGVMTVNALAPLQAFSGSTTFTGSLVIPISLARSRPLNAKVAVRGDITVAPGSFTSGSGGVNSEVWIQDATGGISVFSLPTAEAAAFPIGQRVEASGCIGAFSGQKQVQSVGAVAGCTLRVALLTGGSVVAPTILSGTQINALGANEGRLVTLSGFTVTGVSSGASFTVTGTAPDGATVQVRVIGPTTATPPVINTGLTQADFQVGSRYTVTGVLTQFNGTAQIKPRSRSDVSGPTPIGTVRAATVGGTFTISGVVTAAPGSFTSGTGGPNSEIWLQDATGGIAAFSVPTANPSNIQLGDQLEVTGATSLFSGQLQIGTSTVTRLGAGTPVTPLDQTGAQVAARTNEGRLVRLAGFTVTAVGGGTGNAFTVTGNAPDGTTGIQVRIIGPVTGGANNTGLTRSAFTIGNTYTIVGVLTQFNGTAQIKPRITADVVQTAP